MGVEVAGAAVGSRAAAGGAAVRVGARVEPVAVGSSGCRAVGLGALWDALCAASCVALCGALCVVLSGALCGSLCVVLSDALWGALSGALCGALCVMLCGAPCDALCGRRETASGANKRQAVRTSKMGIKRRQRVYVRMAVL